jgi:hypothetical protein
MNLTSNSHEENAECEILKDVLWNFALQFVGHTLKVLKQLRPLENLEGNAFLEPYFSKLVI